MVSMQCIVSGEVRTCDVVKSAIRIEINIAATVKHSNDTHSVCRITLGSRMSPDGGVYVGPFNREKLVASFEV